MCSARLSHQDLRGYNTLRSLRRARLNSRNSNGKEEGVHSFNNGRSLLSPPSLERRSSALSRQLSSGLYDEDILVGNALFPISTNRFPVKDCSKDMGQSYMGVCMPRVFVKLFPNDQVTSRRLSFVSSTHIERSNYDEPSEQDISLSENVTNFKRKRFLRHEARFCLLCCRSNVYNEDEPLSTPESPNTKNRKSITSLHNDSSHNAETEVKLKVDILKHAERLSNPVWTKQSKQALLHLKQRHPSCFQDVCLYSEVCHLVSIMTYRLSTRRFLQELFLDLNFEELFREPDQILKGKSFSTTPEKEESSLNVILMSPDEFSKQGYLDNTLADRCTELSNVMRTRGSLMNAVVMASDTNRNVTKGFNLESTDVNLSEVSSQGPLASVKEESALENAIEIGEFTKQNSHRTINKNIIDTLKLTCSENKFPITNRNDHQVIGYPKLVRSSSRQTELKCSDSYDSSKRTIPISTPNTSES